MRKTDLKLLSNDALLLQLSKLVEQSRRVESVLVAHIAEVDARRLYAREAMPSMHQFCTGVLKLSDAEAYLRIEAARTSRRYPVLLTMLENGRLHLSGIGVIAPVLKQLEQADGEALLERAVHKSKREIKVMVAELAPRPDVPPSIRKAPERQQKAQRPEPPTAEQPSSEPITTSGRSDPEPPTPSMPPAAKFRDHRAKVEPLAPARYIVQFTASDELRLKLERLKALLPGHDLASMVEAAVSEKLERLEAKRFAKTNNPKKSVDDADTSPGVRGISAPVKRFVRERDDGQCTFVSNDGRRCPERNDLEFHHVKPYARGGDRSTANIVLLCRAHNQHTAETDYGKDFMDRYRRSPDTVREPSPTYELRPDVVGL